MQERKGEEYHYMYAFTLEECYPMDFIMSNYFTATFPDSFFIKMKMCTIPTKDGRITLTDDRLKIVSNGKVTERQLNDEEEYNELLKKYFKLDLDRIK